MVSKERILWKGHGGIRFHVAPNTADLTRGHGGDNGARDPSAPPLRTCTAVPLQALPPPLPRVVSLQNAFSLTCRTFESHLSECCLHEGVSLLAYSPLAMGLLTVT